MTWCFGYQDVEPRTWMSVRGTQDMDASTWNPEHRCQDVEPRTQKFRYQNRCGLFPLLFLIEKLLYSDFRVFYYWFLVTSGCLLVFRNYKTIGLYIPFLYRMPFIFIG